MLKLKEYRLKIGLTQSEIAFKLGMNQQSYSRYENGTTEPNIETLIKIADFFQISIDDALATDGANKAAANAAPATPNLTDLDFVFKILFCIICSF